MGEEELTFFQQGLAALETFIYAGCLLGFFFPFLSGERNRKTNLLKAVCIYLSYIIMSFAGMYALDYGWLCMISAILILSALSGILQLERKFVFWLSFLFFYVHQAATLIVNSLFYLLKVWFADGVDKMVAFRNMTYIYLVTDVIQFLLIVVMLFVIVKMIKTKKWELHRKELCYLCLFPVIGLVFSEIVSRLLVVVKDHVIFGIYEQYPVFLAVVPLIAILFFVGIIATILSYQQIMALQEEKRKYFVEQQQMITLKERTEEVEQLYEDTRRLKHEMRNHLMNIKGLSENQNYEELEQYIARMDMDLTTTQFIIKTNNAVTDVIVNDKKKEADKLGIMFQSEFICPSPEKYNVYDIGIILSNLLTNALEACAKINDGEKYIVLTGRQKRKFFLVEVKNSFEGEIVFDRDSGLPVSTKEDNLSLHGIGLSNVRSAVEKYMGDADIKVTKNEFCVTVLLQEHKK